MNVDDFIAIQKALSAVQDDGMSIADASKLYSVSEDIIAAWIRDQNVNDYTVPPTLRKLRKEKEQVVMILNALLFRGDE